MAARPSGFTLIESLLASATLVILFAAIAIIVNIAIRSIGEARVRHQAIRLATDKLELVQNLAYDDIGVVGGIPAGLLQPTEIKMVNGMNYTIRTTVLFVDDPFDGEAPTDLLPADYKRIRVEASWGGIFASKKPVIMMTDVTPKGMETVNNSGTLSITVFDAQGGPVSNALVHIESPNTTPPVSMDAFTDTSGKVLVPGAAVCANCYRISASKNGYTSDRTYGFDEVANPIKPHVSILDGRVSEASFAIDIPSTLIANVTRSKATGYFPFTGVQFILRGTKLIGRTDTDDPVYKYEKNLVSGAGGSVTIGNLEWDSYSLAIPETSSVDFAGSWPLSPLTLNPGATQTVAMVVEPASANTLLIQMEDDLHQPIPAAMVELKRDGFIATASAGTQDKGDWSQAFFPNLNANLYDLTIKANGFETATASVTVTGDVREYYILQKLTGGY